MDTRIEKKGASPVKVVAIVVGGLLASWLMVRFFKASTTATFRVERDRVTISTVAAGDFDDFIPIRGAVTPLKTVYLDAIDGGRVERVLVEQGAFVEADQILVELSNTGLQLDVIAREAEVSEQLNNLRNTRLSLEQNRLQLKSDLVEIDYQLVRLGRLVERRGQLLEEKMISQREYDDVADELEYYRNRREITLESQEQEERMRVAQMESLEDGVRQLQANLAIARHNLDDLHIRAPLAGQLTALDVEVGESKSPGERLGQIDDIDSFKVTALVDEFYVTRVRRDQIAEFVLSGTTFPLVVTKVYPEIEGGQFEVDLAFTADVPQDIRRGQTLQIRLQLGESGSALLLARGGFQQDTGGSWAFVLDASGEYATRRELRLGRQNPRHFEVLDGLVAGDKVITSPYTAFAEMDRITFK
jgi:HlyD family secretion protein